MRAALLAMLLLFTTLSTAAAEDSAEWRFEVRLDDKPIGFHTFTLRSDGARQVLETEASFDVKVLFVTAFRYRHENTEVWRDGCLASVDATTDSNGRKLEVSGRRVGDSFALERSDGRDSLDGCVRSFAYWNPAILDADRLLNTQTGEYEEVDVTARAADRVDVSGNPVDAERYTLAARGGDITLWYAESDGRWLGLEAPAKGGRRIRYLPVDIPDREALRIAALRVE